MVLEKRQNSSNPIADTFVLLSGGVDSMLCAHFVRSKGYITQGLFVDYGQPAARNERDAAEALSRNLGLRPLLSLTARRATEFPGGEIIGRNAFLIFSAMMLAGINRGLLVIGVHSGTPYYDCSLGFMRRIADLVSEYTDGGLQLIAPLLEWEKPAILTYAKEQNLPLAFTYSCEAGASPPCGECLSCRDRRRMGC